MAANSIDYSLSSVCRGRHQARPASAEVVAGARRSRQTLRLERCLGAHGRESSQLKRATVCCTSTLPLARSETADDESHLNTSLPFPRLSHVAVARPLSARIDAISWAKLRAPCICIDYCTPACSARAPIPSALTPTTPTIIRPSLHSTWLLALCRPASPKRVLPHGGRSQSRGASSMSLSGKSQCIARPPPPLV